MKRIFYLLALMGCMFSCAGPEGPEEEKPIKSNFKNSPTSVFFSSDQINGEWRYRYYFFDLNHKETKDKKYFVAEFIYSNSDTMKIVVPPQSIDNLASNFPADIMDYPGFGWAGQWTNPSFRLLTDKISGPPTFYKDFIPSNPQSNLYFLNMPEHVGGMAGKWPNAYINPIRVPDGQGSHTKIEVYFYFKHGVCYNRKAFCPAGDESNPVVSDYQVEWIENLIPVDFYNWETVDAAFASASHGAWYPTYFFFDFKDWSYFTWKEGCNLQTGACTERSMIFSGYKDLDDMMVWPEGWGKP